MPTTNNTKTAFAALPRKLNLGCGKDVRPVAENWLNVDVVAGNNVEYLDMYSLPWPFPDCEFDMILASHVLEHVPFHIERYGHTKNFLIMFMEEMWRILKPAGRVEIIVPGGISSFAYAIDHKRIVTAKTFHVFYPNDEWSYYTDCRFELIKESRKVSFKFRVLRKLMLSLFDTDIDLLSPRNRHIVLQKIG